MAVLDRASILFLPLYEALISLCSVQRPPAAVSARGALRFLSVSSRPIPHPRFSPDFQKADSCATTFPQREKTMRLGTTGLEERVLLMNIKRHIPTRQPFQRKGNIHCSLRGSAGQYQGRFSCGPISIDEILRNRLGGRRGEEEVR